MVLSAASAICYLAESDAEVEVVIPHLIRCLRTAGVGTGAGGNSGGDAQGNSLAASIRSSMQEPETLAMLYAGILPLIKEHRGLWRPYLEEFYISQSDQSTIKTQKVDILETLCNESNVNLVVRELTTYVRWQTCMPLVARAVKAMGNIALSVSSGKCGEEM